MTVPLECLVSCQTQGLGLEFITALPTLFLRALKNLNQTQFQSACH
ncbi:hypothetical protein IFVP177_C1210018 [Vibrio parahaemolyticus]